MNAEQLAARIQHTNVNPAATRDDIDTLLAQCTEHGFDGAMLAPIWVPYAAKRLRWTNVKVCTAFDYPMGGSTTASVIAEAQEAFAAGAAEVDVMTKVGWLKSGLHAEYRDHLAAIVAAAEGRVVKAMLEAALLEPDELEYAVDLCADAGISYVKNSSGYGGGNASPEIVAELQRLADGRVGVKASGGIRTFDDAVTLLHAGADLLGASGSVEIVTGRVAESDY
jgi:deoxyribose-phosphate aldolase